MFRSLSLLKLSLISAAFICSLAGKSETCMAVGNNLAKETCINACNQKMWDVADTCSGKQGPADCKAGCLWVCDQLGVCTGTTSCTGKK